MATDLDPPVTSSPASDVHTGAWHRDTHAALRHLQWAGNGPLEVARGHLVDGEPLWALGSLRSAQDFLAQAHHYAVAAARAEGASWERIASALRMSVDVARDHYDEGRRP